MKYFMFTMNKELIKLIYNKYDTITLHPYTLEDLK